MSLQQYSGPYAQQYTSPYNVLKNIKNTYRLGKKVIKKYQDMQKRNSFRRTPTATTWVPKPIKAQRGSVVTVSAKRAGSSTTVTTKSTKRKRGTNVKVSKTLKAKIRKVITGDSIKGKTQEITYGAMRWTGSEDCEQLVQDITSMRGINSVEPLFSMNKILDAASVLWNEKVQAVDKQVLTGNFDNQKLRVKIINSSTTYNIRNNTQREAFISLLEVSPTSAQVIGDPFGAWIAMLARAATGQGPNQSAITVSELHTHPCMLPDFRKLYNTKTTKIVIPPGGAHTHIVQGPCNKFMDYAKVWNGSLYQNYHREAKWLIAIYHADLVTTTLGAVGRYLNPETATPQYGIAYEAIDRYVLELPEQAGYITPVGFAGNTSTPLGQRQWSFAYKSYFIGGEGVGSAVRIDDEQPATTEVPL